MNIFNCEAADRPYDAVPIAGKAIAQGFLGNQRGAILTMQSALRRDCGRLAHLPVSYQLKCDIDRLADSLERHAYNCDPAQAWLTVAALRLVICDRYAAKAAFHRAVEYGACGRAVDNLAFQLRTW